ncbi:hypothetical protein [Streptomyces bauhiniae]|uniref:protein kinase domain-containing protein n=1 Tax=Streptomyces bauhiniae TaxID=2340725 RepID=UPI003646033C
MVAGYGLVGATLAPRPSAPSYASPEQARDERVGPATDLWALGAILYTMVECRPPFRERGPFEAKLRSVDRLPPRNPLRAGPLARAMQGLLRKDARERLSAPVVRDALARALREDPGTVGATPPRPRSCGVRAAVRDVGRSWSRYTLAAGTALAVVALGLAVLAATHRLPGTDSGGSSAAGTASRPPATATPSPPGGSAAGGPAQPSATAARPVLPATTCTGLRRGYPWPCPRAPPHVSVLIPAEPGGPDTPHPFRSDSETSSCALGIGRRCPADALAVEGARAPVIGTLEC